MNLCDRPAQRITQLRAACAGEHSTAAGGKSQPLPIRNELTSREFLYHRPCSSSARMTGPRFLYQV